jgi:ABC-type sugar transport system substrate-binding protein
MTHTNFVKFSFILALLLIAAACGKSSKASGERTRVGFSQIGAESGWRTANTQSIRGEAEKRRDRIDLDFADAQQKQENQIKAIQTFIDKGVDVIAFSPVITTGFEQILRRAKDAGIPIVLTDRAVDVPDDSLYATFIGSDFVNEGVLAAEWLAKKTGGKAMIAELVGTPGSAPAIDRKAGFESVLKKYPEMKIIKSQSGDFTRAGGKQVFEAFLKSPDAGAITALYAHNDDMALGAIQAMEAAGKRPGRDILIVSIDAVADALRAVVDGKINCSVECNPMIGPIVFDTIEKLRRGEKVEKRIVVPDQVFDDPETVKKILDSRAY